MKCDHDYFVDRYYWKVGRLNEVLKCKINNDVREVGIEWAINQSKELLDFGIPVLHFYLMGKSDNILKIGREVF